MLTHLTQHFVWCTVGAVGVSWVQTWPVHVGVAHLRLLQHLTEALERCELTQLLHQLHWVQVHPLDIWLPSAEQKKQTDSQGLFSDRTEGLI